MKATNSPRPIQAPATARALVRAAAKVPFVQPAKARFTADEVVYELTGVRLWHSQRTSTR